LRRADLGAEGLPRPVDEAEEGQAGRGQELRQGQLGGQGLVHGVEREGDGPGEVAAVGVDVGVDVLEGAGPVGGAHLQHVVHLVDHLAEHEDGLGVDDGEAREGALEPGLGGAVGQELFRRVERLFGPLARPLESLHDGGGEALGEVGALFRAVRRAAFHFAYSLQRGGEGIDHSRPGFGRQENDLDDQSHGSANQERDPSLQEIVRRCACWG
jgi:hypothetical protein